MPESPQLPAEEGVHRTINNMSKVSRAVRRRTAIRRGYSFVEVIITLVLAAIMALVATALYTLVIGDATDDVTLGDARQFERNVRSLANTDLAAPNPTYAAIVMDEMTVDEKALSIVAAEPGYEVTRNGVTFCVVLGDGVNELGTISKGSCS